MSPRLATALELAAVVGCVGCAPLDDEVFIQRRLDHGAEPLRLTENAGAVELPVRLSSAPAGEVSASYRFVELEAQTTCQSPDFRDFLAPSGRVTWKAGNHEATIPLLVVNDDIAELDERLTVELDDFRGVSGVGPVSIPLMILDDDRSGVIDANREEGLTAGSGADQAGALQAALDAAAALGRGVVQVAAGDYQISSVMIRAGTTLSARGARFLRPTGSPATTVSVTIEHQGDADSAHSLLEGATLDGRRDDQGPYQGDELLEAHLVALRGNAESAGRLRASVEGVRLLRGTASGVYVGPQVDASLCRLHGEDVWRDVVTLRGGGSRVDAREIDASASTGTTGLWFDGQPAGFSGTRRIEVVVRDTRLASGDLEIEAYEGSLVELERFSMTRGPLRLQVPDGTVRISDSVLQTGIASGAHNFFGLPHDVTLTRTTLTVSETDGAGLDTSEADRALAVVTVRFDLSANTSLPTPLPAAAPPHRLVFDQCTFLRGPSVEAADTVVAVDADTADGSVTLLRPTFDTGVEPLGTGCTQCSVEP
jgi:hypothetical protein